MSRDLFQKNHRLLFYGTWLFLGIIQSGLTELQDDEAYYWVYSQFPDWGYFDHPPMTAFLIKAGYAIFPNELGVRLLPLLLHVGSIVIIEKLLNKKDPWLFYAIMLSIAALQLGGFIAVPDNPLIFFTALFFLWYKRFIESPSLFNTFLLGLAAALLCYSKYHAALIVIFTLLSNLRLLLQYRIYLAGIICLLLFMPHLWWQYQHDWVSFKYHLLESNVSRWKASYTIEYFAGQLLLAGPIAGLLLFPSAFGYKPVSAVERALRYTLFGIYLFFLLMSFRGQVEGNWTSPALAPLVVLAHQSLTGNMKWRKWLFRLLPVTLILVMLMRIAMIVDVVPLPAIEKRYHAWKDWPQEMREQTKNFPIVFRNSYQRASKYWFYSGQPTYSVNLYKERMNNFNFWPMADSFLGKPVYVLDTYDMWKFEDSLRTPIGWVGYRYDPAFVSFSPLRIKVLKYASAGDSILLHCKYQVPELYRNFILQHPDPRDTVRIGIFGKQGWIKDIFTGINLQNMSLAYSQSIQFKHGLPPGKYYMRFAINRGFHIPTHNSEKIALVID